MRPARRGKVREGHELQRRDPQPLLMPVYLLRSFIKEAESTTHLPREVSYAAVQVKEAVERLSMLDTLARVKTLHFNVRV